MYFYFSSDYPAVIKLNGIFYGTITNTIKSINIQWEKPVFVEICPVANGYKPINFILDENFLFSPPDNVSLTNLKGGYLFKFSQIKLEDEFRILAQEKYPFAVVTVFYDQQLKLSVETPDDFLGETLSCYGKTCKISPVTINGIDFIGIIIENNKSFIYIYDIRNGIKKVFQSDADGYSFNNEFYTTEKLNDIAKHNVKIYYQYTQDKITEYKREVNHSEKFSKENLTERILPFAFMEELCAGGNIDEYLTDDMLNKKEMLTDYIGDFIGIMPPPVFRNIDEMGVVYKEKENIYYVNYFNFDIENKKITNIKRSAD